MANLRFLSLLNRTPITIKNVRKDQFQDAVEFMKNNYVDDPLLRSLGITGKNKDAEKFLSALWLDYLGADMSLAAVNRRKIHGLSINVPMPAEVGQSRASMLKLSKNIKIQNTRNLFYAWQKMDREPSFPNGKRILELAGLAVGFRDRGKGLARELVQGSADLAKLSGFDYFRVNCTNPMTSRICDSLGWKSIWETPYQKFEGLSTDPAIMSEFQDFAVKIYLVALKNNNNDKT